MLTKRRTFATPLRWRRFHFGKEDRGIRLLSTACWAAVGRLSTKETTDVYLHLRRACFLCWKNTQISNQVAPECSCVPAYSSASASRKSQRRLRPATASTQVSARLWRRFFVRLLLSSFRVICRTHSLGSCGDISWLLSLWRVGWVQYVKLLL